MDKTVDNLKIFVLNIYVGVPGGGAGRCGEEHLSEYGKVIYRSRVYKLRTTI